MDLAAKTTIALSSTVTASRLVPIISVQDFVGTAAPARDWLFEAARGHKLQAPTWADIIDEGI